MDGGAAPQAPALSPAVLSPAVQGLVASIGAVRAQVPAELPGPLALVEAAALLRELQVLQAVVLARLADVDTRQLHALDDAASAAGWVQRQGTGYDRGQVALARKVSRMPAVAAEVLAGRLTVGQALQIGRSLDAVRPHLDRPDGLIDGQDGEQVLLGVIAHGVPALVGPAHGGLADDDPMLVALLDQSSRLATDPALTQAVRLEQAFVLLARHVQPEALAPALGMLVDAVLPVQHHERTRRGHEQRGLRLVRTADGFRISRGDLDLETGELLLTVLAAAPATDPDNPTDTQAWADTESQPGPGPRSRVQRDHDALRLALRLLLDTAALGQRGKAAPHLDVTITLPALHGRPGALPGVTTEGTRVPPSQVTAWLPDSRRTRYVLSPGSRVLEVSHTQRTLTGHERRTLELQWGHRCADADCHAPPGGQQLVPHHATPWAKTGTTSLVDSVPLCPRSHRDLHVGRHTLRLRDGRRLGPDGWIA